jgi:hypothetical protein
MFQRNTAPPPSESNSKPSKKLDSIALLATWLAYFSTVKIEAVHSPEALVGIYQTMQHCNPEDHTRLLTYFPIYNVITINNFYVLI